MKRFGMMLFLLGLSLLFTSAALAVDVKFSGEYYVAGMYLDRTTLKKDVATEGPSTAFYFQRLRLMTDFTVSPGLKLITRFDALERSWGATRSNPASPSYDTGSSGTRAENENIALDWAYIHYASPIGLFRVGFMNDNAWGTVFADGATPKGKLMWSYTKGPWLAVLGVVKMFYDKSYSVVNNSTTASDVDNDKYVAAVKYSWTTGETGLLGAVGRDSTTRPAAAGNYKALFYALMPYAKAQIGPVKLQTEFNYFWGKWQIYETSQTDQEMTALLAWIDATADFGKFYLGGSVAYVSGDDPGSTDKIEANSLLVNGGRDWMPCLILFNSDLTYWAGNQVGHDPSSPLAATPISPNPYGYSNGPMTNAWFFQGRAGVRPVDKLDVMASVSFANADKKPTYNWLYNDYGYEIDLTANYKITNNLNYMLGAGYLFTGKYFKGTAESQNVRDNYLLINKLTLTF